MRCSCYKYPTSEKVLTDGRTPDYTDIIVFTDEYSDDEDELYDTVLSLAQEKNCAITIIFTEDVV